MIGRCILHLIDRLMGDALDAVEAHIEEVATLGTPGKRGGS